ncbi:hypothetical protein [Streptomyces sp. SYP-A7185]|uniref:hypothetical protein n=1 Tax=Streptomyces sp. SYP-A7185 TaxID=3040076 RepID=UPI0038F81F05
MTRRPEPHGHDQAVQQWLVQHQHALTRALDDLLDTEAGLREILLHSHHDTATDNLDTVLDAEAGLAAILPTPRTPPADTPDTPHHLIETPVHPRALSPAERMALRNNRDVEAARKALAHTHDIANVHDLAPGLARHLARAIALDLAIALQLDLDLDLRHGIARDLLGARYLTLELAIIRALEVPGALDRYNDFDSVILCALAIAQSLDLPGPPPLQLARVHQSAGDLARALDRARDLDRAHDLARARGRARDLVRALDLALAFGFGRNRDMDHARGVIVAIHTAEVGRAIGLALDREPLKADADRLSALLDDFTTADLSDIDLTGIDLGGVRWSEHTTRWPPVIDSEDLKVRSDHGPPGSGIWIVRSGTATVRDCAER